MAKAIVKIGHGKFPVDFNFETSPRNGNDLVAEMRDYALEVFRKELASRILNDFPFGNRLIEFLLSDQISKGVRKDES